jgi:TPR repeat protein
MNNFGAMYEEGVKQNEQALFGFERAAVAGDPAAMCNLGMLSYNAGIKWTVEKPVSGSKRLPAARSRKNGSRGGPGFALVCIN